MIYSMTAYARKQIQAALGTIVCELRGVNHRYLEISFKLPDSLRELEPCFREQLRRALQRGKIECQLRYHPPEMSSTAFHINASLAHAVSKACDEIVLLLQNPAPIQAMDILTWPGVLQLTEVNVTDIAPWLEQVIGETLADFMSVRAREGEETATYLHDRLNNIETILATITSKLPQVIDQGRQRLQNRFAEVQLHINPERLEQEMIIFMQKIDVAEEIERLRTHTQEVRRVLGGGGAVGRRLDFLMQELNREANTLGAKSVDVTITQAAVELKVIIEQMREQVQNIE